MHSWSASLSLHTFVKASLALLHAAEYCAVGTSPAPVHRSLPGSRSRDAAVCVYTVWVSGLQRGNTLCFPSELEENL